MPSGQGMWQFVATDGTLYPTTQDDKYTILLQYSADPVSGEDYYWSGWDKFMDSAVAYFNVSDRSKLLLYYYSDVPGTIRLIATPVALDVNSQHQPWRYEWALYCDVNTGLITNASLIIRTKHWFQSVAPISRLPRQPWVDTP
jgi:hypothetical protein